jgi:hypothetical protein
MANLKSAKIQAEINDIDAQIQAGASDAQLNVWEMQKSDLKKDLETALAEEARTQSQTEAVESITLPLDFNDLFENPLANEMIIEVVKQFQIQAYANHNAELEQIKSSYEGRLRGADEREAQLQRQNGELQNAIEAERQQSMLDAKEHAELMQQIAQLGLEKQDAESKRDAAVSEKEGIELLLTEKQAQIEQLRQDLANAPAPKQAIDITPTDKLAQMVKESTIEKANRGLMRWGLPTLEIPTIDGQTQPVAAPEIPALQEVHTYPSENEIPTAEPGLADQASPILGESAKAEETTVTLESLHARVKVLEDRLSPAISAVAQAVA